MSDDLSGVKWSQIVLALSDGLTSFKSSSEVSVVLEDLLFDAAGPVVLSGETPHTHLQPSNGLGSPAEVPDCSLWLLSMCWGPCACATGCACSVNPTGCGGRNM